MSKPLTKNARWVLIWVRSVSKDVPLALPQELTFNTGRWSYDVPTAKAISDSLDFSKDNVLASRVYEIDVSLFPYAKQFKEVTELAKQKLGVSS